MKEMSCVLTPDIHFFMCYVLTSFDHLILILMYPYMTFVWHYTVYNILHSHKNAEIMSFSLTVFT